MTNALAVGLGGALGAMLRYGVGTWLPRTDPTAWPLATLGVNVAGSALLGFLVGHAEQGWTLPESARLLLTVGLCGGFTTFSSFAYETTELATRGQLGRSAAYAAVSVMLCALAVVMGRMAAGR